MEINIDLGRVARDLRLAEASVQQTVELLDEGNTVPFITRYRKDQTGGLDEEQIRTVQDRVAQLRQLAERKQTVLKSLESQGSLTPELSNRIRSAQTSKRLEDIYLPFRPKKQTLATIARERGLEPLADQIAAGDDSIADLQAAAEPLIDNEKSLANVDDVLGGVGHILAERFSERIDVRSALRDILRRTGVISVSRAKSSDTGKEATPGKVETTAPPADDSAETKSEHTGTTDEVNKGADAAGETSAATTATGESHPQETVAEPATPAANDADANTTETSAAETTAATETEDAPAETTSIESSGTESSGTESSGMETTEVASEPSEADDATTEVAEASQLEAEPAAQSEAVAEATGETSPPDEPGNLASAGEQATGEQATGEQAAGEQATGEQAAAEQAAGPDASAAPAAPAASGDSNEGAPDSAASTTVSAQSPAKTAPAKTAPAKTAPKKTAAEKSTAAKTMKAEAKSKSELKRQKKRQQLENAFKDYFDFREPLAKAPPHRILAINRGDRAKVLRVRVDIDAEQMTEKAVELAVPVDHKHAEFLRTCVRDAVTRLVCPALTRDVRRELTEQAEQHAVQVFVRNLRKLLLQPPVRGRRVLAIDPGFRNGCKIAVLDQFGQVLDAAVILMVGKSQRTKAGRAKLVEFVKKHDVQLIAIGNGAGCRETEQIVSDLLSVEWKERDLAYVIVNEAGTSVYSTSPTGREELPTYDPMQRSAISIGRRLLDPLSELVKINPANIGVGLYQHDIKAKHLRDSLDAVVESCVNYVGVDVNTASPALLRSVSGLNQLTARRLYEHRLENGPFVNREQFKQVTGFGDATFVQAAGFLKILSGDNPLDATAIHPESYEAARKVLERLGGSIEELSRSIDRERPATPSPAEQAPAEQAPAEPAPPETPSAATAETSETPATAAPEAESTETATGASASPSSETADTASAAPESNQALPEAEPGNAASNLDTTAATDESTTEQAATDRPSNDSVSADPASTNAAPTDPAPTDTPVTGSTMGSVAQQVAPSSDASPATGGTTEAAPTETTSDAVAETPVAETPVAENANPTPPEPTSPTLQERLQGVEAAPLANELQIGELLLRDILTDLARPMRDPREDFPPPMFRRGVMKLEDLEAGIELEAVVLNVVDFGAFVDIGLTDSGLIHISRLADRYIKDPHEVVSVGDRLAVWVVDVDMKRRRVSLTAIRPGTEKPQRSRRTQKKKTRSASPTDGGSAPRREHRPAKKKVAGRSYVHRDRKPPKPKAPAKPITKEMVDGEEPMRSFSDLAQFFGKKTDDKKTGNKKNDDKKQ